MAPVQRKPNSPLQDYPSLESLQDAIDLGSWKTDSELRYTLWNSYMGFVENGEIPPPDFGLLEFWDVMNREIFGDDEDEIMLEAARQSEQQQRQNLPPFVADGIDEGIIPRIVDYSDSSDSSDSGSESEEDVQVGGAAPNPLPLTDYFTVYRTGSVFVRQFRIHSRAYRVRFNNLDQMGDYEAILLEVIRRTLADVFTEGNPTDEVGVQFRHPGLYHGYYNVPFLRRSQITAENILAILLALIGYDEVDVDADLEIVFTRIPETRGGRPRRQEWSWEAFMAKHAKGHGGCFIQIYNPNDDLCLPRALIIAKARLDKANDPEVARQWESIRKGDRQRYTTQRRLATELAREAGLGDHEGPYGQEEMRKLQEALSPEYQIKIFSRNIMNTICFAGPPADKVLHIYHISDGPEDVGHFMVLTAPHVLFNREYYCDVCDKAHNDLRSHKCPSKCLCCFRQSTCEFTEPKPCTDCNRTFRNEECFQAHLSVAQPRAQNKRQRVGKSVCERYKRCKDCSRVVDYSKRKINVAGKTVVFHQCGHFFCRNCKVYHKEGTNECFMQKIDEKRGKKKPAKKRGGEEDVLDLLGGTGESEDEEDAEEEEVADCGLRIIFDFEATQSTIVGENKLGPVLEHVPNFCHVQKACDGCRADVKAGRLGTCAQCGPGAWRFKGEGCRDEFCSWLFSEENRGATVLTHNSKGYDSIFLVQYLLKNCMVPTIIPKGREFMMVAYGGIKIIDSLNFFPMGLSQFPKAFNLAELKKGFFPHKFNRPENQEYSGRIPDAWYFDPGNMKPDKRTEFYSWYKEQKDKEYNFSQELEDYCKSDVDILMRSCLTFEDDMEKTTEVRPFDVSITIASACMHIFRKLFLKKETIGLIPHGGYRGRENQSVEGLRWLKWISEEEDIHIQHAGNGYEKRIGAYKVDGYHPATNTVYEYNGCVFHGHSCIKDRSMKVPNSRKTTEEAHQAWLERERELKRLGYSLVVKWGCELKRDLREDPHMARFFRETDISEPLDIREALRGGRTNATRLYYKCGPGERMDYVDVVSLYPWGLKWTVFPVGHPVIHTENFQPITAHSNPYFGIIRCTVLPPRKLLHPVLPYKLASSGKLCFPLCRCCGEEQRQGLCNHRDSERALTGEWVSTELNKALQKGYKVVKVIEVWHYEKTDQFDGVDETTGLFTKYVNFFLKMKIEATGWPKWVQTEEDKAKFLKECKEREGIDLDPSAIEKNPGRRLIAKLCLNSFWGKFGQRSNMAKSEYIVDPKKFFEVMFDQRKVVENFRVISEEMIYVQYTSEEEYVETLPYMNKVIAAFTTANCRLRLYEELERLGQRVCYFDTDSIIYLTRPGDVYHPKLGSFLGEMTNELEEFGPDAYISEFVSAGAKNYAYRVQKKNGRTETKVKVRGFTLNYHASTKLSMANLKRKVFEFVKEGRRSKTSIVQPQIARTADTRIITKEVAKDYGVVYDKRWVLQDFTTLPYGTCEY